MTALQGIVQAGGAGTRLGLGPKAFLVLGGKTLLARAVETLLEIVDDAIVAVPASLIEQARSQIPDKRVRWISGGASRAATTRHLIEAAHAPLLVLHDVVHPFVEAALISSLVETAKRDGAAAPAIRNTEFLYGPEGAVIHRPGAVLIGQKPVVFHRRDAILGFAHAGAPAAGSDPSLMEILMFAGMRTSFVEGSSRNIKITHAGDLDLARAMMGSTVSDGVPPVR
jgi:2-C-methyl-D-erythritol 4-phosphate cytidylyltransferase